MNEQMSRRGWYILAITIAILGSPELEFSPIKVIQLADYYLHIADETNKPEIGLGEK